VLASEGFRDFCAFFVISMKKMHVDEVMPVRLGDNFPSSILKRVSVGEEKERLF
jgi:hypothetical protein